MANPNTTSIDEKAIEKSAFRRGFAAATSRIKEVAAAPISKGNESTVLGLLGDASFIHLSAAQFTAQFEGALASQANEVRKGWADAHAQIRQERAA